MKTVHGALAVYARAKAANDEEVADTISPEQAHDATDATDDAANQSASGWDPFEVWRTRIKVAPKSDHHES
jgi:hypothetical protein